MKRLYLSLVVLAAAMSVAQEPAQQPAQPRIQTQTNAVAREYAPTYSDLNCAGFISKDNYNAANYLLAGAETPSTTQFGDGDTIFLTGSGYEEGKRYEIIRALRDPNQNPAFVGQHAAIAAAGRPYQELGHVRVTSVRGNVAIADVEFSCSAMVAGDLVVPYVEKDPVHFRPATKFVRFPTEASGVTGRILMAKEFDVLVGDGQMVYLDVGSSKGIKVGDYFRAVRTYDPLKMDEVDALSYRAKMTEDTMYNQPRIPSTEYAKLPKRGIGEMIVVSVTPTSATAMVTNVVDNINVGDTVELEGGGQQQ